MSFLFKEGLYCSLIFYQGYNDITIGVPCIIGKNGIEKIVELPLNEAETALFAASEAAVAKTTGILKEINAL